MTTFLLIRHGMTDAVGTVMTGRAPGLLLNGAGVQHVATLPQRLAAVLIDAVLASPLERTVATAQVLAAARGLEVQLEPRITEIDYGAWTGRRYAAMAPDTTWQLYNSVRSVSRPPDATMRTSPRGWSPSSNVPFAFASNQTRPEARPVRTSRKSKDVV